MFDYFYWQSIKTGIEFFGSYFNNLIIKRKAVDDDSILKEIKVPIIYSNKDKLIARYTRRGNDAEDINDVISTTLPRMGFEITDLVYDSNTILNKMYKIYGYNRLNDLNSLNDLTIEEIENVPIEEFTTNKPVKIFTPVPYNMEISLFLLTDREEDYQNILEKILPEFTPTLYKSIKYQFLPDNITVPADIIERFQITLDCPLTLHSVNKEILNESTFDTQTLILNELKFGMKIWLFTDLEEQKIIKNIIVNFKDYNGEETLETLAFYSAPLDANSIINLDKWYNYFYSDFFQDTESDNNSTILY